MKKILSLTAIIFSLFTGYTAHAQVNINVNLGRPVAQEPWYATDNNYYYLPEQGVYYNVSRRVYVFPEQGNWLYASRLPARYGNYTYRTSQYVRVNDRSPFARHSYYKQHYGNGNNPKAQGRHDNGNHNGQVRQRRASGPDRVKIREVNHGQSNGAHGNNASGHNEHGNGGGHGNQGNGHK